MPLKSLWPSPAFRRAKGGRLAAARMLKTGAALFDGAAILGHKALVMSKRYSYVSPVRLAMLIAIILAPGIGGS